MAITHQFNDKSFKTLVNILRERPDITDLVKEAAVDPDAERELPDTAFAWQEERMFPIDTPANATLSWLYAEKNASVPHAVKHEIGKALEMFDVDIPDAEIRKTAAERQTNTADPKHFLLPQYQLWYVNSGEQVKLAETALHRNSKRLSTEDRTRAAVSLVKKAQEFETELNIETLKIAGMVASDLNSVSDWLRARAEAAPDYRDAYEKIAAVAESAYPLEYDRDTLIKLAQTIGDVDTRAGMSQYYGSVVADPIQTVFNTEKLAEVTVDMGDKPVPLSKLASVPIEVYGDVFGDEIIPEITTNGVLDIEKAAQVIETMPRDLKIVLRKQLQL